MTLEPGRYVDSRRKSSSPMVAFVNLPSTAFASAAFCLEKGMFERPEDVWA